MGTVKHTYRYSVEQVIAKMTDPDFLRRRSEKAGHRNIDVKVEERGGATHVRITRDIESDIPSFAKKVVDAVNRVTDFIEYRARDGGWIGTYRVEVSKRIRISGEWTVRPAAGGCEASDTFTATVDIPLIGRKIAELAERDVAKAIRDDNMFTEKELAAG
jgi:uncharacterized protein DUF2505